MQFIPRKGTNHLDQTHVPPPNRQLLSSPALLVPLGQTLRSVEGQTCSWDSGACGEEGRRARQAVDCSPTRGQAPPPLPFHHQDRLMEARFQATFPLRSEPVSTAFILLSSCSTHDQGSETGGQVVKGELF
ncbi:hypothetical protein JZ751_028505, partial [Albula glossodonta]